MGARSIPLLLFLTVQERTPLEQMVRGPEPQRLQAVEALVQAGASAVEPLVELLRAHPVALVRAHASNALGRIGKPALPALVAAVERGQPPLDLRCLLVLERIGAPAAEAVPTVVRCLERIRLDPARTGDLVIALRALAALGPTAMPGLVDQLLRVPDPVPFLPATLERAGACAVPALLARLDDPHRSQDATAVLQALGVLGPAACAALPRLLAEIDTGGSQAEAAAQALGRLGACALPELRTRLRSPDLQLVGRAARALGAMGPAADSTIPLVVAALADAGEELQVALVQCLAELGPKAAVAAPDVLRIPRLRPRTRAAFDRFVTRMGSPVVQMLVPLLASDEPADVRSVLGLLCQGPHEVDARSQLLPLLEHPDPDIARLAARALWVQQYADVLGQELQPDRTPARVQLVLTGMLPLAQVPPALQPAVRARIADPDAEVARAAILAVHAQWAATPEVVGLLEALVRAPAPGRDLRTAAIEALGRLHTTARPAFPTLLALVEDERDPDRTAAATAMGRVGAPSPAFLPRLVRLGRSGNADVRSAAVSALAGFDCRGPEIRAVLRGHLTDPDPEVRAAATSSLITSAVLTEEEALALVDALPEPDAVRDRFYSVIPLDIMIRSPMAGATLLQVLAHGVPRERARAARGFERLIPCAMPQFVAAVFPPLELACQDPDPEARAAAERALAAARKYPRR